MRYLCCCSGGKDSVATVILAHLHGEPIDEIVYSEVMFDKKRNYFAEPVMAEFVREKLFPTFESWGYPCRVLHSDKDYLDVFYHVIEGPRKHLDHKGKKYGFCLSKACAVKRECKEKPIREYLKAQADIGEYIQYIGIAADEKIRLYSMHNHEGHISLLEKYGYAQKDNYELCKKFNLLAPHYKGENICYLANRSGCFFCPNAKLEEHSFMKAMYPDVWEEYVSLESEKDLAFYKWNAFSEETLHERDLRL